VTLYFWDASDFDWGRGPMDLGAAKADGITGFSHKATEGTSVKHTHTGDALNRARNAGMEFIGAYHVVRSINVSAQVDFFLSYLDQVAPWWRTFPGFFMQVDLELWPYDQVSAATGMAFASQLVAAQPKRVITYASRGQYGNSLTGIVTPLWNAAYGSDPAVHYPLAYPGDGSSNWAPYSGWTPVFWQYGSQLRIGTQPTCDCSAFRGSVNELRELIVGEPAPEEESMQRVVRDPHTGQNWIGDGIWRRAVTGQQATDWINAGVPYDGDQPDMSTYGRDVDAISTGAGGLVPHTHAGGQTGPAQPT
jgi:GH25 family lysozyme M1 (1,4-beta-N-acetylmuramidase)